MIVLILNAGSSSLKYQVIQMDNETLLGKGLVERIGIEGSKLTQTVGDIKTVIEAPMKNHTEAIKYMLEALTDSEKGVIKDMNDIFAVGHRVLHGGEKFTASVLINDDVIEAIKENIPLGPLHNPANLMGIKACMEIMPGKPMVAVFDTAFHQTMPPKAFMYGVPMDYYKRLKVRRYGFHGTSHRYVSKRALEFLKKSVEGSKVITCHLGNGSSIAAVVDGKCVDTSMGITPLEGLVMGTRSGSLDPAVVQFIANNDNLTVDEVLNILNKKSGLAGLSGVSSDMRDIHEEAAKGNKGAEVARDMLVLGIKKYIGAYAAEMGGVDVIVFTAGIGENDTIIREMVLDNMEFLGVKICKERNKTRKEAIISTDDSKVTVVVIPTNEEIVIARDTVAIVSGKTI